MGGGGFWCVCVFLKVFLSFFPLSLSLSLSLSSRSQTPPLTPEQNKTKSCYYYYYSLEVNAVVVPVRRLVREGRGHVGVGLHQHHLGPEPGLEDRPRQRKVEAVDVDLQHVQVRDRHPGRAQPRGHRDRVRVLLHDREAVLAEGREVLLEGVEDELVSLEGGSAGPALEERVGRVVGVPVEGAFSGFLR